MKKTIMMILVVALAMVMLVGCGKQYDDKIGTAKMYVVEHHDAISMTTGETVCMSDEEVLVEYDNGNIETMTRGQWELIREVAGR